MDITSVDLQIEAALLSARKPVSHDSLLRLVPSGHDLDASLRRIGEFWSGRSVRLVSTKDGHVFLVDHTLLPPPKVSRTRDLRDGSIATLAVIAIHQPVTYKRIEEIRRKKVARSLILDLEKAGLVEGRQRGTGSGKAVEYYVTERFLEDIGIQTILDFPTADEALALRFRDDGDVMESPSDRLVPSLAG